MYKYFVYCDSRQYLQHKNNFTTFKGTHGGTVSPKFVHPFYVNLT